MSFDRSIVASSWLQTFFASHSVILGSSSQWRRKVVESAGCVVSGTIDPAIDEKAIRHEDPEELVIAISNAKADSILTTKSDQIESGQFLLCTDQVAMCEGVIREKPVDESEARFFISSYSDKHLPVRTCSGVVVVDLATGKRVSGAHYNEIQFKRIPDDVIEKIVNGNVVYTCCGGFSVDDPVMGAWVESTQGGMDGIMGMPLGLVEKLFREIRD
jgi:septum formation protein